MWRLIVPTIIVVVGFLVHRDIVPSYTTTASQPAIQEEVAQVARVVDGDTIVLEDGRRVRYIGIDTPEIHVDTRKKPDCYAHKATARNRELVEGKTVHLIRDVEDTDRYGRALRYVFVGDVFINDALVREGYALARHYRPNTAYQGVLDAAEVVARNNSVGLWKYCVHKKSMVQR